jgi:N-acetyl-alpha-D-muramate 1-phosphate uridylyltransferase
MMMPAFPVVILAGGLATRLRPVTEKIPKSLVEINGEPFIAHQLRLIRGQGIEHVVICAGYLGDRIQEYVGDGDAFGIRTEFSYDFPTLLGTGGAIKKALPLLGDAFFTLYGDSYLPCDFAEVQRAFEPCGRQALMTVYRNDGQWDRSNVEFDQGRIIRYDKNQQSPGMRWIDYGLGVFRRTAFDHVPAGKPCDLALVYQHLLAQGQLAGFEVRERFYEIGSFDGIEEIGRFLSQQPKPVKPMENH